METIAHVVSLRVLFTLRLRHFKMSIAPKYALVVTKIRQTRVLSVTSQCYCRTEFGDLHLSFHYPLVSCGTCVEFCSLVCQSSLVQGEMLFACDFRAKSYPSPRTGNQEHVFVGCAFVFAKVVHRFPSVCTASSDSFLLQDEAHLFKVIFTLVVCQVSSVAFFSLVCFVPDDGLLVSLEEQRNSCEQ